MSQVYQLLNERHLFNQRRLIVLQQLFSSDHLPIPIHHLYNFPPPVFQRPLPIIWLSFSHKICPITQHLRRSFFANLEPLPMTLPTPWGLAHPLPAPFLNQLVVREGLDSLGVRDTAHAEQSVRVVSTFRPIFETARDGACGPADFDVARRRGPVEDIKRAGLEVTAFKGIEDFPGDGVAVKGVCYVGTELR